MYLTKSWLCSVGTDYLSGILEMDLEDVAEELHAVVKPKMRLLPTQVAEETVPLGASKLGGWPHMPKDVAWPSCTFGLLGFIGQIAFEDIKDSLSTSYYDLPKEGLCLIFGMVDQDEGIEPGIGEFVQGEFEQIPDTIKMIYVGPGETLERRKPPIDLAPEQDYPAAKLTITEDLSIPWAEDAGSSVLMEAEEDVDDLRSSYFLSEDESQLMGYPIHGSTDDNSPGEDWLCFLTLVSHDELGWNWCDGGHLHLFIEHEALKQANFDNIYADAS